MAMSKYTKYASMLLFQLWMVIVGITPDVSAQVIATIGTGTEVPGNTLYSPVYRFSTTSTTRFNRSNIIFTQAELSAVGINPGSIIQAIAFDKADTSSTIAGKDLRLDIYMGNTSNQPPLLTSTLWTDILATHTLVYSNASQVIPNTQGWVTFQLQTPFLYTGGSLEIATETEITGSSPFATGPFQWRYTAGFSDYIIANVSSTTFNNTMTSTTAAYKHRPNAQITYTTPTGVDAGLLGFVEPAGQVCAGNQSASVVLANLASDPLTSVTVEWEVNGVSQGSINWNGTLNTGELDTVSLGSFAVIGGTTYDLKAHIVATTPSGDIDAGNDTTAIVGLQTGLSGAYTINSAQATGGTNFTNFSDMAAALNSRGVCGPTVITVAPGSGPYTEQVRLGVITGASTTNTITIEGSGDTLSFLSTTTGARGTFTLDGTDFVTVNNLVFQALGANTGEFGYAVQLLNLADSNTFTNCTFIANTTATSTNFAAFVSSNSATSAVTAGNVVNNLTVSNCTTIGGYYGMVINGSNTAPFSTGNTITNNNLIDFYAYGLYIRGQNGSLFSQNTMSRPTRTASTTTYMIYLDDGVENTQVVRNEIKELSPNAITTSTAYGIYGTSLVASPGSELLVANNVVSGFTGMNGTNYGIYFTTVDNVKVYHNTVSVDNVNHPGSSIIRAFFHSGTSATNVDVKNNIFSVTSNSTGVKHCLYFSSSAAVISSNHNVLHMGATAGTNHIGYFATNFTTLADWQTANAGAFDQNSVAEDPLFVNPSGNNFTPSNPLINDIGISLQSAVAVDFNGVARPATPDPGAFEFSPPACVQPTDVVVSNITISTADISWTELGTSNNWQVEWGVTGFTLGSGTRINVSGTPATQISGLMPTGSYEVYVRSACAPGNNSIWIGPVAFTTPCILTAPLTENFDGASWIPGTGTSNTGAVNDPCWESNPTSGFFWGARTGTTSTTTSGPSGDNTTGNGNYIFTEGSNGAAGNQALFTSPMIDLSPVTNPTLEFYYHMFGADITTLYVEANNGSGWVKIDSITGAQQSVSTDPFQLRAVYLTGFVGDTVSIRFNLARGTSFNCDVAIDDFRVISSPDSDMSAVAVLPIADGCSNTALPLEVVVKNEGFLPATNFDISYIVTGSFTANGSVTYTATLAPQAMDTVTVGTLNTTGGGTFNIRAWTGIANDANTQNDTALIENQEVNAIPAAPIVPALQQVCEGSDIWLTASSPITVRWFDKAMNQIGTDSVLLTGVSATDTFFADASLSKTESIAGPTPGTGTFITQSAGWGLGFTVTSDVVIESVTVYPTGSGTMNVLILDQATNTVLYTSPTNTISGPGANVVNVAAQLPPGTYKMGMQSTGITNLVRESAIGGFPYTSQTGLVSITGGSTGTTAPTSTSYYWFYDWQIKVPGCVSPMVQTIVEPIAAPSVNLGVDTGYCEGGSISLLLDAQNPGSTYNWNTGAITQTLAVTAPGIYAVTVTNSANCSDIDTIRVQEFNIPVVNLGGDTSYCEGTVPFLVFTAFQSGATYQWNTGSLDPFIQVNTAGTYAVTVTSAAGCVGSDSINVSENPVPVITLADVEGCEGEPVLLVAGPTTGVFQWSTGANTPTITVTIDSIYFVTVTSFEGCSASGNATVTLHPNPVVDLGPDRVINTGDSVILDAGNVGATYLWNTGAITQTIVVKQAGAYSVEVTNADGCTGTDSVFIDIHIGLDNPRNLWKATLFPNPVASQLQVRFTLPQPSEVNMQIWNVTGQQVWGSTNQYPSGEQTISLPVDGLASGSYLVTLRHTEGVVTLPFVKE